jgi:hypothetical protein
MFPALAMPDGIFRRNRLSAQHPPPTTGLVDDFAIHDVVQALDMGNVEGPDFTDRA